MPTGSYLLRRAIYQSSHSEGLSEGKTEMEQKSQVTKTGEDSTSAEKKLLEDEKNKFAGMKPGSATGIS